MNKTKTIKIGDTVEFKGWFKGQHKFFKVLNNRGRLLKTRCITCGDLIMVKRNKVTQ